MKKLRMVKLVRDYLAKRRALGFALRNQGRLLLQFARYADRRAPGRPLTLQLEVQWARLPKNVAPACWAHRLKIVRPFAKYRAAFDPRTAIPPGLRISEALLLRQVDVDLTQGKLEIRHRKFKKARLVPLHPSAVKALERYSRARDQRVAAE